MTAPHSPRPSLAASVLAAASRGVLTEVEVVVQDDEHGAEEQHRECCEEEGRGERTRQLPAQSRRGDDVEQRAPHEHGLPQQHGEGPALQHVDEVAPVDEVVLGVVVLGHHVHGPHGETQRCKVARAVVCGHFAESIQHRDTCAAQCDSASWWTTLPST